MKAISIRQPWAFAIVMGVKDIENRDKRWSVRGPTWIHASKIEDTKNAPRVMEMIAKQTGRNLDDVRADYRLRRDGAAACGAIVGMAEIVDCVSFHASRWFFGPYGLVLRDARALSRAVPFTGALYAFDIPPHIDAKCRANIAVLPHVNQGALL